MVSCRALITPVISITGACAELHLETANSSADKEAFPVSEGFAIFLKVTCIEKIRLVKDKKYLLLSLFSIIPPCTYSSPLNSQNFESI